MNSRQKHPKVRIIPEPAMHVETLSHPLITSDLYYFFLHPNDVELPSHLTDDPLEAAAFPEAVLPVKSNAFGIL